LVFSPFNLLTRLVAREDFIIHSRRENSRSHIPTFGWQKLCSVIFLFEQKWYTAKNSGSEFSQSDVPLLSIIEYGNNIISESTGNFLTHVHSVFFVRIFKQMLRYCLVAYPVSLNTSCRYLRSSTGIWRGTSETRYGTPFMTHLVAVWAATQTISINKNCLFVAPNSIMRTDAVAVFGALGLWMRTCSLLSASDNTALDKIWKNQSLLKCTCAILGNG
jgi:hypothetical protein